jgi:hypothetical protein
MRNNPLPTETLLALGVLGVGLIRMGVIGVGVLGVDVIGVFESVKTAPPVKLRMLHAGDLGIECRANSGVLDLRNSRLRDIRIDLNWDRRASEPNCRHAASYARLGDMHQPRRRSG